MQLSEKNCVPCEGGVKPFTRQEAKRYLKQVNGWFIIRKEIEKEFKFKDFKEALGFINKVGDIAEEEDHHPDIYLHSYKRVKITLSTHAIKGLSENDFILAAKIDKIVE
ncbi:MAG: 4a-hydroxytetrahydrobiopterin dehydratase [Candidatus Aenigmarchaeota archaeon]|nr:4a-hydroxytetrahydrobiopterin dehydratase [Candidatus Aenigmarchaeota archaeon]